MVNPGTPKPSLAPNTPGACCLRIPAPNAIPAQNLL